MKNILFVILSLICGLTSVSAQVEQQKPQRFDYPNVIPQKLNISVDRLEYIDNLVQEYVDNGIIPHALTFVAKNGVVIHNRNR